MPIPTPGYNPDAPGFTGVQIDANTVASTHRDEHGKDDAIVNTIDDGNYVFLQLADIRTKTFSRKMKRNAAGDPIILDPTGAELNGPYVANS